MTMNDPTLTEALDEQAREAAKEPSKEALKEPVKEVEPVHSVLAPDAEEQRAKMLRELAEQRERMHASGTATAEADETVGEPVEAELARLPEDAGEPADGRSSPTGAVVGKREISPADERITGRRP